MSTPRPSAPASSADGPVDTGSPAADPPPPPSHALSRGFAAAAVLIAGLTILSRVVGFGRTLVLGAVARPNLSTAYVTANTIPNIVFEIVAGGALASLVVPLVAGSIARGDRPATARTASALLSWVLVVLVPLAVLVGLFAHPIVELLIPSSTRYPPQVVTVATGMLRVFAVQIPLYGIGIVLAGMLQAHRRFAWPVLAPLLSSVVVIATYTVYGLVEPPNDVPGVSRGGQLILSIGTTFGVVVLSLCLIIPVRVLRLRLAPTLRFDGDARGIVRGLALVGVVTVVAQQLAVVVATFLSNAGGSGVIYAFTLAQTVYLVPWAVLAVPIATSVYPALATSAATGDEPAFARTLSGATRSVLLLSTLGAAALIGAAGPIGRLFAALSRRSHPDPHILALALIAFAPGLIGYGLFALHSRALYARGDNRYAALATVIGWGTVIAASFAFAAAFPVHYRVPALTGANSVGMTVLAIVLLAVVARRIGPAGLHGAGRAAVAALVAGAAGAVAGIAVRLPLSDHPGVIGDIGQGMLSGFVVLAVFAAVAVALDRHDVRPLLHRLRTRTGSRPPGGADNRDNE